MRTYLLLVILMFAACKKKDEAAPAGEAAKTAPAGGAADPAKAAAPAEPFKGPLTVATVMAADGAVRSMEPWDAGFAKLQAKLGPPTKVDGNKYAWAAMEGDDCAYTTVSQDDGKATGMGDGMIVGSVAKPMKVGKDGPEGNRTECMKILGK